MIRFHIILLGAVLATAGLLAPPVAAQDSWGEPYTAPAEPDPGDDVLTISNGSTGPIWVWTDDPLSWDIEVSTVPRDGAVQLDPGMSQRIGLTPGQYNVTSDGNEIGDPIQIIGGREYALEFAHMLRPPDLTFEARLIEDHEDVILSWAGRNLSTTTVVAPPPSAPAPPNAVIAYQCRWHPQVMTSAPSVCPICTSPLDQVMVETR